MYVCVGGVRVGLAYHLVELTIRPPREASDRRRGERKTPAAAAAVKRQEPPKKA